MGRVNGVKVGRDNTGFFRDSCFSRSLTCRSQSRSCLRQRFHPSRALPTSEPPQHRRCQARRGR
eukprot:scaffold602_cov298-Pinguiococcus_pyrenoidosus.AAC.2